MCIRDRPHPLSGFPPVSDLFDIVESPIIKIVTIGLSALNAENKKNATSSRNNLFFMVFKLMFFTIFATLIYRFYTKCKRQEVIHSFSKTRKYGNLPVKASFVRSWVMMAK